MLHVLVLRYTVPADQVAGHVSAHVSYLDRGHATGRFLLSGQTIPSDLGGVILAVGERDEIERLAAEDPFITAGVGEYEILTVEPSPPGCTRTWPSCSNGSGKYAAHGTTRR